ncbi:SDR family NAD(P)-dependent oxidoreductase [Microbacterium hatanonis]|uniref:SDR family oxidoreductase n=1 Tax=Microbacterium hatanonis TaxID=404366 RepID=A0A5C8HWW1_9MICO|nr:SDR family oxidoreductase [Microbacterium hatanonis]TXK09722.1 SDR family oxidoreductase [Microbacterium hatanonis]
MDDFSELVVAVTGGASGIGLATARHFRSRGARVVVLDLAIDDLPDDITGLVCDVSDRSSVDTAVAEIDRLFGGLDILVNNAGISAVGTVADNDDAEWARVLDINIVGVARVTAAALPLLRRSPAASVINVCSIAALSGLPQRALYSASKGAVYALTMAMATDHVREGIRVNCVSPGTVDTPFVQRMLNSFPDPVTERAALDARQATGRMVQPNEVAAAIVFLADPASGSITGTDLAVDGGVRNLRIRPVAR